MSKVYEYYDVLTCDCSDKKHNNGYGRKDKDIQPPDFVATDMDICSDCKKKLKFKERHKITDEKI
jgi:hypothetical protein